MKLHLEIVSAAISERSGETDGRKWHIRNQTAYLHCEGTKYPYEVEISLVDGQTAYQPGEYDFAEPPFTKGKYGLEFNRRPKLTALAAGRKAA